MNAHALARYAAPCQESGPVPGVVFLSGGQDAQAATARLNAMNVSEMERPWVLGFSFARALHGSARDGRYTPTMESQDPPPPPIVNVPGARS